MGVERSYKVSEVARILGVTPYTVRTYLKDGKLRGYKTNPIGDPQHEHWRVSESALKEYLEELHG